MAPRVIYLDQNKWIELAQAAHGKGSARLLPVLEFIRQIKASGLAVFPLSLAHHMETSKRFDAGQQERLGRLMWEISEGSTFASPASILHSEIDAAIVELSRKLRRCPRSPWCARGSQTPWEDPTCDSNSTTQTT